METLFVVIDAPFGYGGLLFTTAECGLMAVGSHWRSVGMSVVYLLLWIVNNVICLSYPQLYAADDVAKLQIKYDIHTSFFCFFL